MLLNIAKYNYRAVNFTNFTAFSISRYMFINLLKYKENCILISDE